jgi:hypothetical protein
VCHSDDPERREGRKNPGDACGLNPTPKSLPNIPPNPAPTNTTHPILNTKNLPITNFVILSEGRSPQSKDLHFNQKPRRRRIHLVSTRFIEPAGLPHSSQALA